MELKLKSYIFGLLGTDGNLYLQDRDRGRITLEVSIKDKDIVDKLYEAIPNSSINFRTRDTNFKNNYESIIFANHQKGFRQELIDFGFPLEDKTNIISPPNKEYSISDFWRGVIDGDGSIGFIADGSPFVSLITKSEQLKVSFCELLKNEFNIIKQINRNKRDNVYNITIKNEDALALASFIYKDAFIYLDRKYQKYLEIMQWKRTKAKNTRRTWTEFELDFIQNNSVKDSVIALNRTESSIKNKKYRLTQE